MRRLSGGASRITSTFDLELPTGEVRGLVLQQMRGTALTRHPGVETEARAPTGGPAGRGAGARGGGGRAPDGLDAGWLVVEHLEGEALPQRILRNDEFAAARAGLTEQTARALAAIHSIDPDAVPGLPRADPLRHPLEFLDALRRDAAGARARGAVARAARTRRRRVGGRPR